MPNPPGQRDWTIQPGARIPPEEAEAEAEAMLDLQSEQTFQIAGRGTVKTIDPQTIPTGIKLRVGERLRVDGQEVVLCGVEMMSPPPRDGRISILVRSPRPDDE